MKLAYLRGFWRILRFGGVDWLLRFQPWLAGRFWKLKGIACQTRFETRTCLMLSLCLAISVREECRVKKEEQRNTKITFGAKLWSFPHATLSARVSLRRSKKDDPIMLDDRVVEISSRSCHCKPKHSMYMGWLTWALNVCGKSFR